MFRLYFTYLYISGYLFIHLFIFNLLLTAVPIISARLAPAEMDFM